MIDSKDIQQLLVQVTRSFGRDLEVDVVYVSDYNWNHFVESPEVDIRILSTKDGLFYRHGPQEVRIEVADWMPDGTIGCYARHWLVVRHLEGSSLQ